MTFKLKWKKTVHTTKDAGSQKKLKLLCNSDIFNSRIFLKLTSIKKACRKSIRDNKFGIDDFFETLYEIGYVKNQLLNTH